MTLNISHPVPHPARTAVLGLVGLEMELAASASEERPTYMSSFTRSFNKDFGSKDVAVKVRKACGGAGVALTINTQGRQVARLLVLLPTSTVRNILAAL